MYSTFVTDKIKFQTLVTHQIYMIILFYLTAVHTYLHALPV